MNRIAMKTNCALAFAIAGMLAAGPALAEKPSWAGGGKGEKSEQRDHAQHQGDDVQHKIGRAHV